MAEIVDIPVADLLLDHGNPRLADERQSQHDTALGLAEQQQGRLVRLAQDIVEHGIDPLTLTAVVATGDRRKRYKVIEGNRRVLALKALETPSLVLPKLKAADGRKLATLASKFAADPIEEITCVLFKSEEAARHWIVLRHTGQNDGMGLVDWGSDEQDRFNARHGEGSRRTPAGQVIEFVEKHGSLSAEARASNQKIITTLQRLLTSPDAREAIGVNIQRGEVVALYPLEEIARSLTRVVEDMKTKKITVPDLYKAEDRVAYAKNLPRASKPKKGSILAEPVLIGDLTANRKRPRKANAATKPAAKKQAQPRTTVVPQSSKLNVTPPRINSVYYELTRLTAEDSPNACSVLLRVFIELSVDHYILDKHLMSEKDMRSKPLAKRLKLVTSDLEHNGAIPAKLRVAIDQIADGGTSVLAPSITVFNQYVHNQYVFPKARDLYIAWDEMTPFLEQLWP